MGKVRGDVGRSVWGVGKCVGVWEEVWECVGGGLGGVGKRVGMWGEMSGSVGEV